MGIKKVEKERKDSAKQKVEKVEEMQRQKLDKGKVEMTLVSREVSDAQPSAFFLNRFAISKYVEEHKLLTSNHEKTNEDNVFVEPRKAKAVSARMADLIRSLKPKKKVPDKAKHKKVGSNALGGHSPSPSS